jgi:hypothetical protein
LQHCAFRAPPLGHSCAKWQVWYWGPV